MSWNDLWITSPFWTIFHHAFWPLCFQICLPLSIPTMTVKREGHDINVILAALHYNPLHTFGFFHSLLELGNDCPRAESCSPNACTAVGTLQP